MDLATGRCSISESSQLRGGDDPIVISRCFSTDCESSRGGWEVMPHLRIEVEKLKGVLVYWIPMLAGGRVPFLKKDGWYWPSPPMNMMNTHFPNLSGGYHPLNMIVTEEGDTLKVLYGDGSHSIYFRTSKHRLRLVDECLTSGKRNHYSYADDELICIEQFGMGGSLLTSVSITTIYPEKNVREVFYSGDSLAYEKHTFKKMGKQWLLSEVLRGDKVIESYHYRKGSFGHYILARVWAIGGGSFSLIYYPDGILEHWCGYSQNNSDRIRVESIDGVLSYTNSLGEESIVSTDEYGRIKEVKRGGVRLLCEWDHEGCLLKKEYFPSEGEPEYIRNFVYDARKNIISDEWIGKDGRLVTIMGYDSLNREVKKILPSGLEVRIGYLGNTTLPMYEFHFVEGELVERFFWRYDQMGLVIEEIRDDGSGLRSDDMSDLIERKSVCYERTYDLGFYGSVKAVEESLWNKDLEVNSPMIRIEREYNKMLLLSKEEKIVGDLSYSENWDYSANGDLISKTDSLGQYSQYNYDDEGHIASFSSSGLKTSYHYNEFGFPIREGEEDEDGNEKWVKRSFDTEGRVNLLTYSSGRVETFTYDPFGRSISDKLGTREFDLLGRLIWERDAKGNQTDYSYGIFACPTSIRYPDGGVESWKMNSFMGLISWTDQIGREVTTTRDQLGRVIRRCSEDVVETYIYDRSKLKLEINGEGESTCYKYDSSGQLIGKDGPGIVETFTYDECGQEASHGLNGQVERYTRDEKGRVVETWIGKLVERTRYDQRDLIVERQVGESSMPMYHEYDSWSRLTKVTNQLGEDSLRKYSPGSIETMDRLGRVVIESLDEMGQRVAIEKTDERGEVVFSEKCGYWEDGLPKWQESGLEDTAIHFTYDPMGRLAERLIKRQGSETVERMQYNFRGALSQIEREDGSYVNLSYDRFGNLTEKRGGDCHYTYKYDKCGRLVWMENRATGEVVERVYKDGCLVEEKFPSGCSIKREYALGRLVRVILPDNSTIEYLYDEGGLNRIIRVRADGSRYTHGYSIDSRGLVVEEEMIFNLGLVMNRYDPDQFCVEIGSPFHLSNIEERDSIGNPLIVDGESYKYDSLNQIVKEGCTPYRWNSHFHEEGIDFDKNGRWSGDADLSLTYDSFDRLVYLVDDRDKVDFGYDGLDRLIWREEGGVRSYFLYIDELEIGSMNQNGIIEELRINGLGLRGDVGGIVAIELDDTVYATLSDAVGNVSCLVDVQGTVIERYFYSAFGQVTVLDEKGRQLGSSQIGNPWQYKSKRCEELTGLIHYPKRVYSSSLKTFLQKDPLGFEQVPNWHHFNYNNPFLYIDLFGLQPDMKGTDHTLSCRYQYYAKVPYQGLLIHVYKYLRRKFGWSGDMEEIINSTSSIFGSRGDEFDSTIFINGINYTPEETAEIGEWLAVEGAGEVTCVENRTEGFMGDLQRSLLEMVGLETETVHHLRACIQNELALGRNAVKIVCHSEGALIANLALRGLTQTDRDSVVVHAFGSPIRFSEDRAGSVYHYVNQGDMVPWMGKLLFWRQHNLAEEEILQPRESFHKAHSLLHPASQDKLREIMGGLNNVYSK